MIYYCDIWVLTSLPRRRRLANDFDLYPELAPKAMPIVRDLNLLTIDTKISFVNSLSRLQAQLTLRLLMQSKSRTGLLSSLRMMNLMKTKAYGSKRILIILRIKSPG